MTEANNNANSVNSQNNLDSIKNINCQGEQLEKVIATAHHSSSEYPDFSASDNNTETAQNTSAEDITTTNTEAASNSPMNWQKVAHKLREYNRKLLKKVFRLEQELAEIDNKFNKYIEKSRNSDLLVAQQEAELQKYQEQIAVFSQQLATSQAEIDQKSTKIEQLLEECQSAQQQTAQIERDCTLLQEKYDRQAYELNTKEQDNKELHAKLSQQQRYTLQYQAELKRYRDREALSTNNKPAPEIPLKKNRPYSPQRSIQPWSNKDSDTKISLPQTKVQPIASQPTPASETIKTAAEIATWSVAQQGSSQPQEPVTKTTKTTTKSQSAVGKKPQTLAAVDLPTFPRPS